MFTKNWSTLLTSLEVWIYQGDLLFVVMFNTVMNTLVDTLQTRLDFGFCISDSQCRLNLLQYADDTCILASGPASAQHLLDMVDRWLLWSGMRAKVAKYASLTIQGSSGQLFDPKLSISQQKIPFMTKQVKFLGMRVEVPHDSAQSKATLLQKMKEMMEKVDKCSVTI